MECSGIQNAKVTGGNFLGLFLVLMIFSFSIIVAPDNGLVLQLLDAVMNLAPVGVF